MGTTILKETHCQKPTVLPRSSQQVAAQAVMTGKPEANALAGLRKMADNSPQVQASANLQRMANTRATLQLRPNPAPAQRMEEDELQGKFVQRMEEEELQMKPIQRMEEEELQGKFIQRIEDEDLLQGKAIHRAEAPKANNTGLPDTLKSGIENLSGLSMDHVQVHRNSDKPAAVQAHAYAQGSQIHLAPGQEKHLPHEAWHVVQQAQGRVRPTMQMKGVSVNDDAGLEKEADIMGAKASSHRTQESQPSIPIPSLGLAQNTTAHAVQRQPRGFADTTTLTANTLQRACAVCEAEGDAVQRFKSTATYPLQLRGSAEDCAKTHQEYKALGNPRSPDKINDIASLKANLVKLEAIVAGRQNYLDEECDYVLQGSIDRGSPTAENGHKLQLQGLKNAISKSKTKIAAMEGP